MKDLFYMGGPLFMGVLTVVLIAMVAWTIYHIIPVLLNKEINRAKKASKLKHIKTIGTFGLATGILGQLIGLSAAFDAMERAGDISQSLLAGGLKVSTIVTIYGILIFLISLLLWFICDNILSAKSE
jgi:biopolymer transport protein ExbB/TolQ